MGDNRPATVLAVIAVIFLLHWGQAFFIPLFVALMLAFALSPVVNALERVVRFRVLASALVVGSLIALAGAGAYALRDDVAELWQEFPNMAKKVSRSVKQATQEPGSPVAEVQKAAREMESITREGKASPPAAAQPAQGAIPVWQVVWRGWKGLLTGGAQVMVVLFLVFFMLASGDLFKRKLMTLAGPRLSQRKLTLEVINEIDKQIRRFLAVLAISNVMTGVLTWIAFRALGVEYAELWGIAAGILNTAPYFGPAMIAVASLVAGLMQFDEWKMAFMVAGASVAVQALVGALFETWFASRMARMNATATFVGLLFFGAIWGLWGVLLGIPLLAIVKTVCDYTEDWKPLGELLGR